MLICTMQVAIYIYIYKHFEATLNAQAYELTKRATSKLEVCELYIVIFVNFVDVKLQKHLYANFWESIISRQVMAM